MAKQSPFKIPNRVVPLADQFVQACAGALQTPFELDERPPELHHQGPHLPHGVAGQHDALGGGEDADVRDGRGFAACDAGEVGVDVSAGLGLGVLLVAGEFAVLDGVSCRV